jgi:hypothetical protein
MCTEEDIIDYATTYNTGWRDGQKEIKERLKARGRDDATLESVRTSMICTVKWLENGADVNQAIEELKLQIEKLEAR